MKIAKKDKRSAELAIANKELAFQNEEKEKRAAVVISLKKIERLHQEGFVSRSPTLKHGNKVEKNSLAHPEKFTGHLHMRKVCVQVSNGPNSRAAYQCFVYPKCYWKWWQRGQQFSR